MRVLAGCWTASEKKTFEIKNANSSSSFENAMQALSVSQEKKASGELVTVGDRKITPWIKGREKKTDLGSRWRGVKTEIYILTENCVCKGALV